MTPKRTRRGRDMPQPASDTGAGGDGAATNGRTMVISRRDNSNRQNPNPTIYDILEPTPAGIFLTLKVSSGKLISLNIPYSIHTSFREPEVDPSIAFITLRYGWRCNRERLKGISIPSPGLVSKASAEDTQPVQTKALSSSLQVHTTLKPVKSEEHDDTRQSFLASPLIGYSTPALQLTADKFESRPLVEPAVEDPSSLSVVLQSKLEGDILTIDVPALPTAAFTEPERIIDSANESDSTTDRAELEVLATVVKGLLHSEPPASAPTLHPSVEAELEVTPLPTRRQSSPYRDRRIPRKQIPGKDTTKNQSPERDQPSEPAPEPSLIVKLPIPKGWLVDENMAPVKDVNDVPNTIKDVIQHLYDIQSQTHGFIPETQDLLVDKITDLTQSLSHLQKLTSQTESPNHPVHTIRIAPEIVDYVDDGRNPDIFTRDFVENVQRGNAVINGKRQAFKDFSQIFAKALKEGITGIDKQVDRVMKQAEMQESADDQRQAGSNGRNGQ